MRFLTISLLCVIVGCASYPKKQAFATTVIPKTPLSNLYFSDQSKDYIYKANISVQNNNFSGLLIVKKIQDSNHRVAFTTEMGNKLFDFSFIENEFHINYIIEDLNRKFLINVLKVDFKALTKEHITALETYKKKDTTIVKTQYFNKDHYYYFVNNKLQQIIKTAHQKQQVSFLFSDLNNNIANLIQIEHKNIKLNITLKSIN